MSRASGPCPSVRFARRLFTRAALARCASHKRETKRHQIAALETHARFHGVLSLRSVAPPARRGSGFVGPCRASSEATRGDAGDRTSGDRSQVTDPIVDRRAFPILHFERTTERSRRPRDPTVPATRRDPGRMDPPDDQNIDPPRAQANAGNPKGSPPKIRGTGWAFLL